MLQKATQALRKSIKEYDRKNKGLSDDGCKYEFVEFAISYRNENEKSNWGNRAIFLKEDLLDDALSTVDLLAKAEKGTFEDEKVWDDGFIHRHYKNRAQKEE